MKENSKKENEKMKFKDELMLVVIILVGWGILFVATGINYVSDDEYSISVENNEFVLNNGWYWSIGQYNIKKGENTFKYTAKENDVYNEYEVTYKLNDAEKFITYLNENKEYDKYNENTLIEFEKDNSKETGMEISIQKIKTEPEQLYMAKTIISNVLKIILLIVIICFPFILASMMGFKL